MKKLGGQFYVVARGPKGRAMLIHRLLVPFGRQTACGRDASYWSVEYLAEPIRILYCLQCAKKDLYFEASFDPHADPHAEQEEAEKEFLTQMVSTGQVARA